MTQPQFEEFLTDKYGAGSEDGIHHYEITQASGRQSGQGAGSTFHIKLKSIQMKKAQYQYQIDNTKKDYKNNIVK